MTTPTRIYNVNGRLVRATNQAQAVRHVAKDTITCSVATQEEIVEAMLAGKSVEDACESPANDTNEQKESTDE